MPASECTVHIATPPHASGAIAILHLTAKSKPALDDVLARITSRPVNTGSAALRDLAGVDRGIIARPTDTTAMLMPHGGAMLVRMLADKIESLGIPMCDPHDADPCTLFPEANDIFEACALDAISRAPSKIAPSVILHQANLWRRASAGETIRAATQQQSAQLNRLLSPPTVAAIGPSNIGKSTLTNALARRTVATVADEPATTRDAVGVSLDLAGLTVTWIDTAGRVGGQGTVQSEIDRQAEAAAARLTESADLVVSCADGSCEFITPSHTRIIRCATRADIAPRQDADIHTAAQDAEGAGGVWGLARLVSETLLPPAIREFDALWRFHPALPAPTPPR